MCVCVCVRVLCVLCVCVVCVVCVHVCACVLCVCCVCVCVRVVCVVCVRACVRVCCVCVCVYIRTIPKSINTDNQDSDMRKMFGYACVKEGME